MLGLKMISFFIVFCLVMVDLCVCVLTAHCSFSPWIISNKFTVWQFSLKLLYWYTIKIENKTIWNFQHHHYLVRSVCNTDAEWCGNFNIKPDAIQSFHTVACSRLRSRIPFSFSRKNTLIYFPSFHLSVASAQCLRNVIHAPQRIYRSPTRYMTMWRKNANW